MLYIIEEHANIEAKLGVTARCASSSSINGSDERLGLESLPLICVCLIKDGVFIFRHVVGEEEASGNTCRLIFIGCSRFVHISMGVYQMLFILAIITL